MPEPKESAPTNGTPESASAKVARKITRIPENLKGPFNLREKELLEIATQGSQNRMLIYGGSGGGIDFADLRELLGKQCQLEISLNVNFPKEDAGKARVFNGQESPDQPPSAIPIGEALTGFQKALERKKTTGQPASKETQLTKDEKANKDYLEYVEQGQDEEADLLEASVKTPEKAFEKKPSGELTKLGKVQKDYVSAVKAWIKVHSLYDQALNKNEAYKSAKSTADEADGKYYKAYKESGQKSYEDFRKTELGGRLGKEMDRCSEALIKVGGDFVTVSPGKELYEAIERTYKTKKIAEKNFGQVRPKWPIAQSAESSPSTAISQMLGIVEPGEGEMREQFKWDSLVGRFWNEVRDTPDKQVFGIGRKIRFGIRLHPEELKLWSESKGNMFPKNPFGEKLTKLEKILLPQKEIQEGFARLVKEHAIEKDGELRTVALQVVCENLVKKHGGGFDESYYVAKHDPRITSDLIEILKQKKDEDTLRSYPKILDILLAGSSKEDVLKVLASSSSLVQAETLDVSEAKETAWLTALAGKEFQGEENKVKLEAEIKKFRDNLKELGYRYDKGSPSKKPFIKFHDQEGDGITGSELPNIFMPNEYGYQLLQAANQFLENELQISSEKRAERKTKRKEEKVKFDSNLKALNYTFEVFTASNNQLAISLRDEKGANPYRDAEFGNTYGFWSLADANKFLEEESKKSPAERVQQKQEEKARQKANIRELNVSCGNLGVTFEMRKYQIGGKPAIRILNGDKKTPYLTDGKEHVFPHYTDAIKFLKDEIEKTNKK